MEDFFSAVCEFINFQTRQPGKEVNQRSQEEANEIMKEKEKINWGMNVHLVINKALETIQLNKQWILSK